MFIKEILSSFFSLKSYCERENFKGWDPFDGLNSKIFQKVPYLRKFAFFRLVWIQFFKRNPINLRRALLVPKGYNPKAIALFLTGYCNLYRKQQEIGKYFISEQEKLLERINQLSALLISLQTNGYSGSCWGYNFDWQNRVFFQPKHTPTVVVTSFCADSLFNAFEITNNKLYLECALSSCNFVSNDLNYKRNNELIFSYSPLDNSQVYNASLLGARLLARGFYYTQNDFWYSLSKDALLTIIKRQNCDGSWRYGDNMVQDWIDSFHTGFNLECIWEINRYLKIDDQNDSFQKGVNFYINSFFHKDGTPKYYHNRLYPIDIHSPAQFIAFLGRTNLLEINRDIASQVLLWTIMNMQSRKGYFFYQISRYIKNKIPYMRWSQAWMFYALSYYLLYIKNEDLA